MWKKFGFEFSFEQCFFDVDCSYSDFHCVFSAFMGSLAFELQLQFKGREGI